MRRDLAGRVLAAGQTARNFQRLVAAELSWHVRIPLGKRLFGWRHGFTSRYTVRFDLTPENVDDFVSDYARYIRTPRINGPFAPALLNKLVFSRIVASHGGSVPEYYCHAGKRGLIAIGDRHDMRDADGVAAACMTGERFIVKPCGGGGGVGVAVISSRDGRLTINDSAVDDAEFRTFIGSLDNALVCEFIVQDEYASGIFPHSTNSIRVISMWDYEKNTPFLAFAGHRFGRTSSIPVDNMSQGGMAAQVRIDSGELRSAIYSRGSVELVWYDEHPDTGATIKGVRVPHWEDVKAGLLELAGRMSYIPYIGWDIVVTRDGFCVIEGNNYPHLGHQLFEPLLKDPRVRAFYERHEVI
ncbi:MAG: sugar-transfer associated ATP-grasp domain-containing protein [Candidatus Eisenbacteria bacterium]